MNFFSPDYQLVVNKDNGTCNVTRIPTSGGVTNWDIETDSNGKPVLKHMRELSWFQDLQYQGTVSNCVKVANSLK